jgi:sigma54-dependent transcription regulator
MVKLNCAAFPQAMIEGELFGYVKGAFTGAANDFRGMIAEAEGSTLFPRRDFRDAGGITDALSTRVPAGAGISPG